MPRRSLLHALLALKTLARRHRGADSKASAAARRRPTSWPISTWIPGCVRQASSFVPAAGNIAWRGGSCHSNSRSKDSGEVALFCSVRDDGSICCLCRILNHPRLSRHIRCWLSVTVLT